MVILVVEERLSPIGLERRARLERVVGLKGFSRMSDDAQRRMLENALRDASTIVRGRVLAQLRRRRSFDVEDLLTPAGRRLKATRQE